MKKIFLLASLLLLFNVCLGQNGITTAVVGDNTIMILDDGTWRDLFGDEVEGLPKKEVRAEDGKLYNILADGTWSLFEPDEEYYAKKLLAKKERFKAYQKNNPEAPLSRIIDGKRLYKAGQGRIGGAIDSECNSTRDGLIFNSNGCETTIFLAGMRMDPPPVATRLSISFHLEVDENRDDRQEWPLSFRLHSQGTSDYIWIDIDRDGQVVLKNKTKEGIDPIISIPTDEHAAKLYGYSDEKLSAEVQEQKEKKSGITRLLEFYESENLLTFIVYQDGEYYIKFNSFEYFSYKSSNEKYGKTSISAVSGVKAILNTSTLVITDISIQGYDLEDE